MTNQYFRYEFRHCGHAWKSLSERSRCRTCREWVDYWSKGLMNGPESIESFRKKIKEVLKRG